MLIRLQKEMRDHCESFQINVKDAVSRKIGFQRWEISEVSATPTLIHNLSYSS